MRKWRIEDSEELYNIKGWGVNYFGINEKGHAYVSPRKNDVRVDLKEIVDELNSRDITAPVLLRFPDILDNRIEKTSDCFNQAAKEYDYKAEHFIIYPIKVNQMRPVVEEIISHGKKYNLGLEAGSKPELHAVLATNMDSDSLIICNGHKDQNFIELALLGQKMGKRVFLVVEKLPELITIARTAEKLGVRPNLGIRIKLAASGTGKWQESGGDASKFGLNSSELLDALRMLDEMGMHDCLKLIHFHIGSQITKIRRISTALREAAQCTPWASTSSLSTVAADLASTTMAHAQATPKVRLTIPFRSMSTTASTHLSMRPTKTTYPTPTSSPRADARSPHTTLCSLST